jgi:pimeloyl-ACP methyl ester carboxylesterase
MMASHAHHSLPGLALEAYRYPFRQRAVWAGVAAFHRMLSHPGRDTLATLDEIDAGLKNLQAPADILWGACDPLLSRLPAYLLRDHLPRAREPLFLPDVSHYLPEEAPEALAEVVLRTAEQKPLAQTSGSLFNILS